MRIRVPMRRIALFVALVVLVLVLLLPLRLALGAADGLTAREVSGPVWSGRLKEARIGPVALGDLDARLAFLPLLTGRARVEVQRDSAAPDRLVGAFTSGANRRSIESVTGEVPIDGAFGALPIASLELTDVTVRFRDGVCEAAEGLVRATLTAGQPGLPSSLSGPVRCDRGAVLLSLAAGTAGDGLALRLFGDGRWAAQISLRGGPGGVVNGRF